MSVIAAGDIGIAFGGVVAVDGVSFSAAAGEVLSIIGPNGAGKTTLFNVVSGLYRARRGRVTLDGEDVTGRPPEILAAKGLSRTFQNLQLFTRMTTCENVMVGRHLRERRSLRSPETPGDRPRPRLGAKGAAPRRAGRRLQRGRDRRDRAADPRSGGSRRRGRPRRARHAARDEGLRPRPRARERAAARRGRAGGGA